MKYLAQIISLILILTFIHCTPKNVEKTMKTEVSAETINPSEQEFRKHAPAPAEAPVIHIEDFSEFTLPNGLKVIVVENHKRPTVSYTLRLDIDPVYEGDKAGYTSIAGQLMNAGTKTRTKADIDEAIDFIGGSLSTSSTRIYGQSLKKHSGKLLDLMQDVLLNPTFPESEFNKVKRQTISGIEASFNDPNAISSNITNMVTYGKKHPYGEFATAETVENIELGDVKAYYNTYFKPNVAYLIIVGDISLKDAKTQAEKYFGSWENADVPEHHYDTPQLPESREVVFVDRPNAVQSLINISYPVQLREGDDDIIAARVMNNVLGGGVFSGYLMQNLREDKAYTYGARSSLSADELIGSFSAYASVRNEVTDSSVVEFLRELNRIRMEPVDKTQLQLVKNNMTGSFSRALERPETVARQAFNISKYNLPKDYYKTYLQRLDKVSVDDVLAAAKKFIKPDHSYIIVVGNKDAVADKLTHFSADGEINYYSPSGEKIEEAIDREPPVGLTAKKVMSDYIHAIGGRLNVFPVNSILIESDVDMMGSTLQAVEMKEEPDKYRQALLFNGNVVQEIIFNNGEGVKRSMQGEEAMSEEELVSLAREPHIFKENKHGQWGNYERLGAEVELVALTKVGKEDAYKIKIAYPNGDIQYDYYSVKNHLKLMMSASSEGPDGNPIMVNTTYKDYKRVGDLLFPHTVILEGAAPQPIVFKRTNIEINYPFDEDTFKVK